MTRPSPLKAACAAAGLTIRDVAAEVGCTAQVMYQVSTGRVEPWPKLRKDLADVFGYDPFAAGSGGADALTADGPMTSRALADRLTLSWGNLRYRLLPRLIEHGLLTRTGDTYALADDLDAALAAAAVALDLVGKADVVAERHAAGSGGAA